MINLQLNPCKISAEKLFAFVLIGIFAFHLCATIALGIGFSYNTWRMKFIADSVEEARSDPDFISRVNAAGYIIEKQDKNEFASLILRCVVIKESGVKGCDPAPEPKGRASKVVKIDP